MQYDFIIVGAGTAGCVLADGLAKSGARVLVLEAGGSDRHLHVSMPAAFAKLFKSKRDWAYHTEPQSALDGRRVFWPRGKMLGGSSSMNAQIHQWCAATDFAAWERLGARGWGWAEMAPALARVDARLNGGPLREPNELTHAFLNAATTVGLTRCEAPKDGTLKESAWLCDVAHRRGSRWSAADAYLRPALQHGASLRTQIHVERIVFDGARAVGVEIREHGEAKTLNATRGVIITAGAIESPHLLLRSGIGPADELQAAAIEVRVDAPQVGMNLQDHLMFVTHHATRRPITLKSAESVANLLRYAFFRRGMLASNVAEAIAFAKSRPSGPIDLELVFAPVLFEKEGLSPPSTHGFSIAAVLLKPASVGRIRLRPDRSLSIDPAYLVDAAGADLSRMIAGAEMARQIVASSPLAQETERTLLPSAWDSGAVERAIRATAHTIYHPVGTCRMGTDASSVVDPQLCVRGVNGLWLADASVFPEIPSGHPNAVVAALAERAVEMIRA